MTSHWLDPGLSCTWATTVYSGQIVTGFFVVDKQKSFLPRATTRSVLSDLGKAAVPNEAREGYGNVCTFLPAILGTRVVSADLHGVNCNRTGNTRRLAGAFGDGFDRSLTVGDYGGEELLDDWDHIP